MYIWLVLKIRIYINIELKKICILHDQFSLVKYKGFTHSLLTTNENISTGIAPNLADAKSRG